MEWWDHDKGLNFSNFLNNSTKVCCLLIWDVLVTKTVGVADNSYKRMLKMSSPLILN